MLRRRRDAYSPWLQNEFGGLIDGLDLDERQKRFFKSRWLDQVIWAEGKAAQTRRRYYALRLTTVIGAVLVPALVSVNTGNHDLDVAARIATWVVSLVVAISAAVEQFFRYGDRWRNYRRTAEQLKTEGWLFLQLGGRYGGDGSSHATTYASFAARTEELITGDVDVFLTQVAVERQEKTDATA